ncbi:hypothetical protein FM036_45135 [Nostoc sp. HG1]|nr:hypothetical protein [Nostoc sp. HG1]
MANYSSGTALTVIVPATTPNAQLEITETDSQEPVVTPITTQPFFLTRLLMSAIASPAVRLGVGGTALAAIVAAVGWSGLNSVDGSQPNPFGERLAKNCKNLSARRKLRQQNRNGYRLSPVRGCKTGQPQPKLYSKPNKL